MFRNRTHIYVSKHGNYSLSQKINATIFLALSAEVTHGLNVFGDLNLLGSKYGKEILTSRASINGTQKIKTPGSETSDSMILRYPSEKYIYEKIESNYGH